MCWISAITIRRASWNIHRAGPHDSVQNICKHILLVSLTVFGITWYNVSSSQWGLIWDSAWAIRLCSLAIRVCIHVRTSCSFTRISPETFHITASQCSYLKSLSYYVTFSDQSVRCGIHYIWPFWTQCQSDIMLYA